MTRFAILGATGATGQQLVKQLLKSPEHELNLYIRSKSKLLKIFPNIETDERIQLFEGSMNDLELLGSCIFSTQVVFSVLASNDNMPGMTIAYDAAASILGALRILKDKGQAIQQQRIVVLSAEPVNEKLYGSSPFQHWIIYHAFWHVYKDLERAEDLYIQAAKDSGDIDVKFIQPGAILTGDQSGTVQLSENDHTAAVSYGDVAAAMIQAGEASNLEGTNFGVVVNGKPLTPPLSLIYTIFRGLTFTFFPWLYHIL
jgi:putative NADH-flavin reductase